jgi:hypothetical protein
VKRAVLFAFACLVCTASHGLLGALWALWGVLVAEGAFVTCRLWGAARRMRSGRVRFSTACVAGAAALVVGLLCMRRVTRVEVIYHGPESWAYLAECAEANTWQR